VATEAAWLDGDNLGKEEIKKKKEKMKKRFDTHRPSHGRSLACDLISDDVGERAFRTVERYLGLTLPRGRVYTPAAPKVRA
jgi:hypothetical protein